MVIFVDNYMARTDIEEMHECHYCGKHFSEHYIHFDDDLKRYYCQDCEIENIEAKKDY